MIKKIKEIYKYRELLSVFTRKELKVRYKNSSLGFLWSFINPLVMAVVYTLIFSVVFRDKNITNYPLFLMVALIPWNFFTVCISTCSSSIISSSSLIKKVRFPLEIIPLSIIFSAFINFLLEMIVIFIILIAFGYNFFPYIPILILAIALQLLAAIGFGFLFASLTVYFRDMEQLIGLLIMIWFFATPIVYSISKVNNESKIAALFLKIFNPMTSIILLYRQALYDLSWPSLNLIGYALGGSLTIFIIGYRTFIKLSPNFAKEI